MQLMSCHDPGVDEAGYLEVIRCKTASCSRPQRGSAPSSAARRATRGRGRRVRRPSRHRVPADRRRARLFGDQA